MKKFVIALAFCLIVPSLLWASSPQIITLQDGSVIQGEITSIEDNKYVIESPVAGTLYIPKDQLLSITSAPPGNSPKKGLPSPSTENLQDSITTAQNKILVDPEAMKDIQALLSDPEVMAIMTDPEFMKAVQSRDPEAIQANPRTRELMENPKIKALIQKLQANGFN